MASELEKQKAAGVTESKAKDGKVDLSKTVVVYGTGTGAMKKDKAYKVHPIHAETLIKAKRAAKDKPKGTK